MRKIRALLLEDDAGDAELIAVALGRGGANVVTERVSSRSAFGLALQEFEPDVVISDHSLAQFNAIAALDVVRALRPAVPVIVVSGALDDAVVVASLRAGAEHVFAKGRLDGIPAAVETALNVRRRLKQLSPRQVQVMRLMAEGDTTREIARKLRVSVKTTETHRTEVMKRLGLHDVVSVVRYAIRVGVVPTGID